MTAGLCALVACGSDAVGPTVISTSPVDQATGVDPSARVEATFSEDMSPATLDATTFLVTLDGTSVGGTVSYDAATHVATFQPDARLALLGHFTATVTTGATWSAAYQ